MRLFVALTFPPEVLDQLEAVQAQLAGNRTRRENLHMTLAFLGENPPARIPALRQLLRPIAEKTPCFSMTLDRLAVFGSGKNALACLTGAPPAELTTLVRDLEAALRAQGFSLEDRDFRPHVTLTRRCGAPAAEFAPIAFTARGLHLMLSERIDGVLTYTPLFSAHFHP